jgi:hypothetical protein
MLYCGWRLDGSLTKSIFPKHTARRSGILRASAKERNSDRREITSTALPAGFGLAAQEVRHLVCVSNIQNIPQTALDRARNPQFFDPAR